MHNNKRRINSSSNTTSSNNIDSKLLHLVRKLWDESESSSNNRCLDGGDPVGVVAQQQQQTANEDSIVARLRSRHREYQRKDATRLRVAVRQALEYLQNKEQEDDAEYDRDAAAHDAVMVMTTSSTGNNNASAGAAPPLGGGLNASLRSRYQQQQQTTTTTANNNSSKNGDGSSQCRRASYVTNSNNSSNDNRSDANEAGGRPPSGCANNKAPVVVSRAGNNNNDNNNNNNHSAAAGPTATSSSTPSNSTTSKRRKLRRSSSRRSSTGAGGGGDLWSGGGDNMDFQQQQPQPLPAERPAERYADLGGLADVVQAVRQLVEYPITRPELYRHLGVDPPRGVLLRGPPGTGKTHLANAVAGQLGVPYFRVSAPELVSGMSGESESRIRDLFRAASDCAPSIIFLDEIDAVAPKRSDASGARGMEKRMVAQLLTCMDHLAPHNNRHQNCVMVLAATNRPDSLDAALRRAGRFDKEILLGVPDEAAREQILRTMTRGMRLRGGISSSSTSGGGDGDNDDSVVADPPFDYKLLARKTPGFVGADMKSLAKEAAVLAINRIFRDVLKDESTHSQEREEAESHEPPERDEPGTVATLKPLTAEQMDPLFVTMDDFLGAIPLVQPSSKREGFATVPDVTWDDIGALQSIREELTISVLEPIRAPEKFQALGLPLPAGILLYGPPGSGKTLLAKAVAHESGANFISVKGPELLDKYVGESERAVRLVFERARSSSPCVVFFDELDSLVPRRGSESGSGGGGVSERVVNQLLTEMDGMENRRSVFVIAATNRPELIDPAMMRPGRLDKLLYVALPTAGDRVSILRVLSKKVTLGEDVDLETIARSPRAEGYSGADCAALLREAGLAVMKEEFEAVKQGNPTGGVALRVMRKHFDEAFAAVMPSVSKKDQARYDRIRDRMARARTRGPTTPMDIEEDKGGGDAAAVAPETN